MYTVVVCSNCKHTWIVKNRPERSQCRKCRKTRLFKKLKKYYKDEDLDNARKARAFMQAKINDQEEHFQRALDKGLIDEEVDKVISESEYLEGVGIDSSDVESSVEQILDSPSVNKSQRKIIVESINSPLVSTVSEFESEVEESGIDPDKALLNLKKLIQSGNIELPDKINPSDIDEAIDRPEEPVGDESPVIVNRSGEWDREEQEEKNKQDTNGLETQSVSQKEALINAATKPENESITDVLQELENENISRDKAIDRLRKLSLDGVITSLSMIEIEAAEDRNLNKEFHDTTTENQDKKRREQDLLSPSHEHRGREKSQKKTSSKKEIMINAIEENDAPTTEDVVSSAFERGISRGKAENYLEKMLQAGEVTRDTDGILRRV